MKRTFFTLLILFLVTNSANAMGILYTDTVIPIMATNLQSADVDKLKMGEAQSFNNFGLIETGDAGIHKAASRAGITKIHHVDVKVKSFLFWQMVTTQVYGE